MFQIPIAINCGYLNVPKFLAETIARMCDGDISEEQTIGDFEDPSLVEPFVEIRIVNCTQILPDVVRKLINCDIPFHFNYTHVEDMEVEYWRLLDKHDNPLEILKGFTSADSSQTKLAIDVNFINATVAYIKAQYKLLDSDIDHLLEVREIHDYLD